MGDFVINDDILAPKPKIVVEYRGPNPFAIYPRIGGLLQGIFQARGVNYFEDDFRWDVTSDPRQFLLRMHLEKGFDKFSEGRVDLKIIGHQPLDPKKNGAIFIEISANIKTKYPSSTPFQKLIVLPFMFLYHYVYYNRIRRQYMRRYRVGVEKLEAEIRSTFNLMMREKIA